MQNFVRTKVLAQVSTQWQKCSLIEKTLLAAWSAIIFLIPFHALLSTWGGTAIGPLEVWKAWKEIILAICLCAATGYLYASQQLRQFLNDKLVWLILAYAALHLVLWAVVRPDAQAAVVSLLMNLRFLGMVLLTLVVVRYVGRAVLLPWALLLTFTGATGVIVFGVLQATILPDDFLRHFGYGAQTIAPATTLDDNKDIIRAQSTLRGPNPFGAYLVVLVPLVLSLWSRSRKIFVVGWLLAAALLLFQSHSRSAWIGMAVALVVYGLLRIKNKRSKKELLIGGLLFVIASSLLLTWFVPKSEFLQTTILHNRTSDTDAGSTAEHFYAGERSIARIAEAPLGQGPGAAGPASFYSETPQIPENYYLQIAEELGLLGLALFVAINMVVAWRLWVRRRNKWAAAMLAGLVGVSVVNLFQQGWADDTVAILWWALAAIVIAVDFSRGGHAKKRK